jgi:hypothetical protein
MDKEVSKTNLKIKQTKKIHRLAKTKIKRLKAIKLTKKIKDMVRISKAMLRRKIKTKMHRGSQTKTEQIGRRKIKKILIKIN